MVCTHERSQQLPVHHGLVIVTVYTAIYSHVLSRPLQALLTACCRSSSDGSCSRQSSMYIAFNPHLSSEHASPTALNGLNLRLRPPRAMEPLGQLIPIPELALSRLHRPQLLARVSANCAIRVGAGRSVDRRRLCWSLAAEGAVLGYAVTVGGEGLGEGAGGGCWVGVGSVVDC